MNIASIQTAAPVATDVPLERLAKDHVLTEEQKITEASRQFESLLLRQILRETQKTVISSEYSENSTVSGIYRDMVADRLAESISKSGAFGLARTLNAQLAPKAQSHLQAGHNQHPAAQPTALADTEALRPFDHSELNRPPATEPLHRTATRHLFVSHERDH